MSATANHGLRTSTRSTRRQASYSEFHSAAEIAHSIKRTGQRDAKSRDIEGCCGALRGHDLARNAPSAVARLIWASTLARRFGRFEEIPARGGLADFDYPHDCLVDRRRDAVSPGPLD